MKRTCVVFALTLFLICTVAVASALAQGSSSISGKVIDQQTRQPIGGVKVEVFVDKDSAKANALSATLSSHDGSFRIGGLTGGQYRVELSKPGYAVEILSGITVRPNEVSIVGEAIAMSRASGDYSLKMACNSLVRPGEVADVYVVCSGK